jgi:hypothetical protein
MSDLADVNAQVLQNRDLVVTRPETGEQATKMVPHPCAS